MSFILYKWRRLPSRDGIPARRGSALESEGFEIEKEIRMLRPIAAFVVVAMASFNAAGLQASSPDASLGAPHRAALNRYCVGCHNERAKIGGLALDKIDIDKVPAGAE